MTLTIDDAVRRNALVYADRPALIWAGGELTWRQLHDRIDRFARALTQLGVGHGDRVAVMQDNGPAYLETNFAIWTAGAVLVGISNKSQRDEVAYILEHSGACVAICSPAYAALVTAAAGPDLRIVVTGESAGGMTSMIEAQAPAEPRVRLTPARHENDLAVLGYTSGTTGRPKGARLSHRNMLASATSVAIERSLTCRDQYLFATPMNHISAISFCAMTSLVGGSFVIPDKFDPETFVDLVRRCDVTFVFLVPTMMHMVIEHLRTRGESKLRARALRLICYGAAPILPELLREALDVFECGFSQAYGMTEASPVVSVLPPEDHVAAARGAHPERLKSAGRATLHARIRVVDEAGRDRPTGEVGEIALAGPSLLDGYWNDPEASRRAIRDGWFHSGDLGYLDEHGYLYVVGREHDMIISGGINVYPREVELVISECPGVSEVAVIGIPDRKWGEAVCACVVRGAGSTLTAERVIDFCEGRLASYKKPKTVRFLDVLPRNATGKIVKRLLKEPIE